MSAPGPTNATSAKPGPAKAPAMKLYGPDNREMMQVSSIERIGDELVLKGKVFGAMPMTAKLRPEELRAALKLVDFRTALFVLTMVFRRKRG
jgi:hypothetical protein